MALMDAATAAATILSGLVSLIVVSSVVVDAVTRGWVRRRVRGWLGIADLRRDHVDTQTFLMDLGDAYNGLAVTVSKYGDVPEGEDPDQVDVGYYATRLDDRTDLERGDFKRGGGSD